MSMQDFIRPQGDTIMLDADSTQGAPPASADSDSEWEYEYDDTETETFYVNVDFSSHNGPIRPPRNRKQATSTKKKPSTGDHSRLSADPENGNTVEREEAEEDEEDDGDDEEGTGAGGGGVEEEEEEGEEEGEDEQERPTVTVATADEDDRIQILDLHTSNPIISYRNQIFSCRWADLVGTELLFSKPRSETHEMDDDLDPRGPKGDKPILFKGKDFELIAANGFKILGHRANLISNTGGGFQATTSTSHRQLGQRTNQQQFLEELARIKRRKGETDTVRTAFNVRRSQQPHDSLRGWARTEERINAIEQLRQHARRGDANATAELNRLYAENGASPPTSRARLIAPRPSTTRTSASTNPSSASQPATPGA